MMAEQVPTLRMPHCVQARTVAYSPELHSLSLNPRARLPHIHQLRLKLKLRIDTQGAGDGVQHSIWLTQQSLTQSPSPESPSHMTQITD